MNRPIKSLGVLSAVFLFVLTLFSACGKAPSEFSGFAMGSVLTAKLYGANEPAEGLWGDTVKGVNETDFCLSLTLPGSDLSRLALKGSEKVQRETADILLSALDICRHCDNKADISIGKVTALWNFSGDSPTLPAASDIEKALTTRGTDKIFVSPDGNVTVGENQVIDCGAFGKGAGCDKIYKTLKNRVRGAVVSLGGNLLLYGENPRKDFWSVAIRNPFGGADSWFATLEIKGLAPDSPLFISTSGDYEKTFEVNGKQYHHILNPDTGYPVENELTSVTVTGKNGLTADGLSTACFVNGLNEKTLSLLEYYGCEGVFVLKDRRVFVTEGLRDSLKIGSEDFTLISDIGNISNEK